MTKLTARILLICLILAVAILACVNGGDGNSSSTSNSNSGNHISAYGPDATATYGAEQFQIQLTAIANPGP
jgi:preprotein translocase subunit SecG